MSVVQPPIPPPLSPLRGLAQNLYNAANRLNRLANDIDDVFLIGDHLASPFYWIAYYLYRADDYCMDADDWLRNLWGKVEGIYSGSVFRALLFWVSGNYYQLAYNAVQWLRGQLGLIGPEWFWLMYDPRWFVRLMIIRISYWLDKIITNPGWSITELLRQYVSWMGSFLNNPTTFVIGLLMVYLPDIWTLLTNPFQFILTRINLMIYDFNQLRSNAAVWVYYRLVHYNQNLRGLLLNPHNFIRDWVRDLFQLPAGFWVNPHYYLLDLLLDKLEVMLTPFQERLKRILVEFILRFI